ncbi:MAG TPA: hypothetical protein VKS01_01775 [Bryobacteraceae bacterium]|nr:hypothetical protein [Bryobacteraceae bacterium]
MALAFAALLGPAALMAWVLGLWRLAAEMGMAGEFGITGVFSHWQIWILIAVFLHACGFVLNRYGRSGIMDAPRTLMLRIFPDLRSRSKDAESERKVS